MIVILVRRHLLEWNMNLWGKKNKVHHTLGNDACGMYKSGTHILNDIGRFITILRLFSWGMGRRRRSYNYQL